MKSTDPGALFKESCWVINPSQLNSSSQRNRKLMGDFAPSCRAEGPGLMELRRSKQNLYSVYFLKGERKTAKGGASLLWDSSPPTSIAVLEVDVTFPGEEEWKQNKTNPLLTIDRDTHPYHVWLLFWQLEFWGVECSAAYKAKSAFLMLPYQRQIQCRRVSQDSRIQLRTPGCKGVLWPQLLCRWDCRRHHCALLKHSKH